MAAFVHFSYYKFQLFFFPLDYVHFLVLIWVLVEFDFEFVFECQHLLDLVNGESGTG